MTFRPRAFFGRRGARETGRTRGRFGFGLLIVLLVVKIEQMRRELVAQQKYSERKHLLLRAMINGFTQLGVHDDTLVTNLVKGIVHYGDVVVIATGKLGEDVEHNPSRVLEDVADGWAVALRVSPSVANPDHCVFLSAPMTLEEFQRWCTSYTAPPNN